MPPDFSTSSPAVSEVAEAAPPERAFAFYGWLIAEGQGHVALDDGRVVEWVDRTGDRVRYRHESARRELHLTVTRTQPSPPFDASIWLP